MKGSKTVYVYLDSPDGMTSFLGELMIQFSRGKEIFSFAFETEWLKMNPTRQLDPELQMYSGAQYTSKSNFGIFLDSAPDRWGRMLMQRREAILAKAEKRSPLPLRESDYLLGVYDKTRMGGLRFKSSPEGKFLNDDIAMPVPSLARLRELEEACRDLEGEEIEASTDKWLSMLIAPGSSLGGARPKANVADENGNLWIAKFPSRSDTNNSSAWEYAVWLMAKDSGLNVPEARLENFSKYGSTFLVRRFDRNAGNRIHFASAMSLLGKSDGTDFLEGSSYLDIAEFIVKSGAAPEKDLRELWTRIVFSIAVSNTDDHLRNHGFLLTESGWTLSPAYDINPNPFGSGLNLNISTTDNALNFSLAKEVAPFFRLKPKEATEIIAHISRVISKWQRYAAQADLGRREQTMMQSAFRF